jgi:hypothetical protein
MSRSATTRPQTAGRMERRARWIAVVHVLVAALVLLVVPTTSAHAQFGALKKLKNKVSSSDSAARAKDSLAQIAAGVAPESVKINRSLLKRSAAVVSDANGALEEKTGISMKDAALAATGAGAAGLVAKKMGGDQGSIAGQAMNAATAKAQQRAMGAGMQAGMAGMSPTDAAAMQAMRGMNATSPGAAGMSPGMGAAPGMAGYSQADAAAIMAFQQEMMQLSMAASAGDATAKARLERWQVIALKYQAEAQRLSIAASTGDMNALQKMQQLQLALMREWAGTSKLSPAKPIR